MKTNLILAALLSLFCISGFAQGPGNDWGNRMKSEKIGFITTELRLTPEEAQSFWPVYNKISETRDEAMRNMFSAFHKLQTALKENKSDKEISNLLNDYLKAQTEANNVDMKSVKDYEKVLPASKVARLFIAEEDFRKMQIRKLSFKDNMGGNGERKEAQMPHRQGPAFE